MLLIQELYALSAKGFEGRKTSKPFVFERCLLLFR